MSETARDEARFSRPCYLPGVELVSVEYRERAFPEHSHGEWVIGAVMTGSESLVVGGRTHSVGAGEVLRLHPDQPHANRTIGGEALRYRVAYIPDHVVASYVADGGTMRPYATPVLLDPRSHTAVADAHAVLSRDDSGRLEQESALAGLALVMFSDGCQRTPEEQSTSSGAVVAARAYIDTHFAEGFGLATLAAAAGISVFHLAHSFRRTVGITPLAYRNQRRIVEARRLLLAGQPIAAVALDVGYADQSHLTRQFQRIVGISPARYVRP
jgi:AraC-like DNA-binding protein